MMSRLGSAYGFRLGNQTLLCSSALSSSMIRVSQKDRLCTTSMANSSSLIYAQRRWFAMNSLLLTSQQSSARSAEIPETVSKTPLLIDAPPVASPPPTDPVDNVGNVVRAGDWRRAMFSSWQRGLSTSLGIATGVGILIFFLAAPMKADTVQQTAQIASQALEDQRLKETATRLTKDVVEQILTDPRSVSLLADVIATLLKQDSSKIAVTSFIRDIFEDRYTQEVTKKFVLKVVSDPWVMDQLHHILFNLVDDLLKDPATKDALKDVLVTSSIDALREEAFQAQSGRAVRSIVWQTIWNSGSGAPPPENGAK